MDDVQGEVYILNQCTYCTHTVIMGVRNKWQCIKKTFFEKRIFFLNLNS